MSTERGRAWRILRILVVDDYPHAAEFLSRLLKRLGHNVETAIDGRQALQSAERFHPEVIFSDIAMPKLDGYELAS
jgi:CheY-like chemotaxis protein